MGFDGVGRTPYLQDFGIRELVVRPAQPVRRSSPRSHMRAKAELEHARTERSEGRHVLERAAA